jgi:mono/diheme cytochrome c family protein
MKRLLPLLGFLGLLALAQSPGAKLYSAHCQSCYQANGQGIPGVFPPLTHLDKVVQAKGGGSTWSGWSFTACRAP